MSKQVQKQFQDMPMRLVKHEDSEYGYPAYIEVELGYSPKGKQKGTLVLDLGNYLYRECGLRHQMTPEYRGRGQKTTLRWFMSWDDIEPLKRQILDMYKKSERLLRHKYYLPFEFSSIALKRKE